MDIEAIVVKLKSYFAHKPEVLTVYLFGSVAKNKQRSDSDLDLALIFLAGMESFERFEAKLQIAVELEDLLGVKIDIVDLRAAEPFFCHQVMLEKKLIVDKDLQQRVDFEVGARREFFDLQRFYDLYHSQALKRLEGAQ
jgi:uncharacterized protein